MPGQWDDIGDFLSKVMGGIGPGLEAGMAGAGMGLMSQGGIIPGLLGGLMMAPELSHRRQEQQRESQGFGELDPLFARINKVMPNAPLDDKMAAYTAFSRKTQQQKPFTEMHDGKEYLFNPDTGKETPIPGFTAGFKPKEEKPYIPSNLGAGAYANWLKANPGDTVGALRAMQQAKDQEFAQQKQIAASTAAAFRQPRESMSEKVNTAAAEQAARLGVNEEFMQRKPFSGVVKDVIPFKNVGGKDVPLPTTAPYGRVTQEPGVFYVPKTDVQNGTFARLQAVPDMAETLKATAPAVVGSGGLPGLGRKEFLRLKGNPAYYKYQAAGAAMIETVTSALSRRVSQPQIDMWKEALYGPTTTPEAVNETADQIAHEAEAMLRSYKEDSGAMGGSGLRTSITGGSAEGETGDEDLLRAHRR